MRDLCSGETYALHTTTPGCLESARKRLGTSERPTGVARPQAPPTLGARLTSVSRPEIWTCLP
eukprot:3627074-Rhodomonas_salina.1